MLRIVRSNRVERLVEALASDLRDHPLRDPMQPEAILVPSRGMERWLAQRLGQRLGAYYDNGGVCANVEFPSPARTIRRVFAELLPSPELDERPDAPLDPWEPDSVTWAILALWAERLDEPAFATIRNYLGGDASDLAAGVDRRAHALARRIAEVFDRYALFRPELVEAFESGAPLAQLRAHGLRPDEAWQPELWRALRTKLSRPSFASQLRECLTRLRADDGPLRCLPERVSVFGLATLPPAQLAVFDALSHRVAVRLYLISPSDHYWADIRSRREQIRSLAASEEVLDAETLALAEGNPLLASFGRVARDFQVVVERDLAAYEDREHFDDPAELEHSAPTMLQQLQSDLMALRNRGADRGSEGPTRHPPALLVGPEDRSLGIHACHGDTRQVEVLRDLILDRLAADPSLEARDILVMSPDIERFAPIVSAVFDDGEGKAHGGATPWAPGGTPRLPYQIADRGMVARNPVAAAFLDFLDGVGARLDVSGVFSLLAHEPVQLRFGLDADQVGELRERFEDAGARWGVDPDDRAAHGQPSQYEFTLRFALDRLALGVTMRDEGRAFAGIAPFDDIEGERVEVFGRFARYCSVLFERRAALEGKRSLAEWQADFESLLDALFAPHDQDAWWRADLRRELDAMIGGARAAGAAELPVELDVLGAQLRSRLNRGRGAVGQQTGAITFCAMAPMRSVPHRVVCLLGLDDGVFPRGDHPPGFDLGARRPRIGDRMLRDEDRFLLLEAIMAARENLFIIYSGRDAQRNETRPPCVPLAELIDHLDRAFVDPTQGSEAARASVHDFDDVGRPHWHRFHALSAHDPRYFLARTPEEAARARFDLHDFAAARASLGLRSADASTTAPSDRDAAIGAAEAPADAPLPDAIEFDAFLGFFANPARAWARSRLELSIAGASESAPSREELFLQGLPRWQLKHGALERMLTGERWVDEGEGDLRRSAAQTSDDGPLGLGALRARAMLPPGTFGRVALGGIVAELDDVRALVQALLDTRALRDGRIPEPLACRPTPVESRFEGVQLTGHLWSQGDVGVYATVSELDDKHLHRAWLESLLWRLAHGPSAPFVAAGKTTGIDFAPLDPKTLVEDFGVQLRLYLAGSLAPLPLFPRTSPAYARARAAGSAHEDALLRADKSFSAQGQRGPSGDGEDPYVRLAWGEGVELGDLSEFPARALEMWGPTLIEARDGRVKLGSKGLEPASTSARKGGKSSSGRAKA